MAKILVTGAAGFVGSNICNWLMVHTNHSMVGVDSMTTFSDLTNLEPIRKSKRFEFYVANVADADIMERIFKIERPNYVIHAAGTSQYSDLIDGVANAASKYPVEALLGLSVAPQGSTRDWDGPYNGLMPGVEDAVVRWHNLKEVNAMAVNLCRLYGPREAPNEFIPKTIKALLDEEEVDPEKFSTKVSEWMYLKDAFLVVCALMQKGEPGKIYNITAGYRASERDMLYKLNKIVGADLPSSEFDNQSYVPIFTGDRGPFVSMDTIGWQPSFGFEQSLEHTVCWYHANRWAFTQKLVGDYESSDNGG